MKKVFSVLTVALGTVSLAFGDVVDSIEFEGLDRVDEVVIADCLTIVPHKEYSEKDIDSSIKALFNKGFFSDIKFIKRGTKLVIKCVEKPMIDKVSFEGNDAVGDDDLRNKITSRIGEGKLYDLYIIKDILGDMQMAYKTLGFLSATIVPKIIKHPGNKVDIVFEINEGSKTTIKKITFIGNKFFDDDTLKEVLVSKEAKIWRFWDYDSHVFREDNLQVDLEHLNEFYKNSGYPFVVVTANPPELSFDKTSIYCSFKIEEGAQYTISGFTLDSKAEKISADDYKWLIGLKSGTTYNEALVYAYRDIIRREIARRGKPFSDVKTDIRYDKEHKTASIHYTIVETAKAFIERIEIVGNTRTLDRVIRREFTVHEGDALNSYKVQQTVERLKGIGYFDDVQITEEAGSAEDKKVLVVTVKEKAEGTTTLRFGLNVSDADGFGGFIGFTETNLMGTGRMLSADAYWAQKLYGAKINIFDPRFLDHNFGAGISLSANRYDRKRYNGSVLRSYSIGPYVRYRISEHLSHRVGYSVSFNSRKWWDRKRQQLVDKIPDDATISLMKDEFGSYTRGELNSALFYDRTDNPYNPRRGYELAMTNAYAGVGGSVRYFRNEVDGTYYYPLSQRFTFISTAKIGHIDEIKNTRSNDRYSLGGDGMNLRGFDSYGVGPRDKHENSVGGDKFWAVSFMVKTPLSTREIGISGLAFLDVGSAWGTKYDKTKVDDSAKPRASIGVAVQWARTPFGMPLSLVFAVPIQKKGFDQKQTFTVGQAIQ